MSKWWFKKLTDGELHRMVFNFADLLDSWPGEYEAAVAELKRREKRSKKRRKARA